MQDPMFESTTFSTQEDFARWVVKRAIEPNRYELLNGRIVMTPPAGYPHGEVEGNIVYRLRAFVGDTMTGKVFGSSQGFELPSGDTVAGDASYVSTERWDAAPQPEYGKFLRVVPDLMIEVLSPSTASRDRGEKKAVYAKNAVREYWLVDPRAREVQVFALAGDRYENAMTYAEGDTVSSRALAGLAIAVVDLFP
jgi:Uma2 family endonuclease